MGSLLCGLAELSGCRWDMAWGTKPLVWGSGRTKSIELTPKKCLPRSERGHCRSSVPLGECKSCSAKGTMQRIWALTFTRWVGFFVCLLFCARHASKRFLKKKGWNRMPGQRASTALKLTVQQSETLNAFYMKHLALAQSPLKSMKAFPLNSVSFGSCLPKYLLPKARNDGRFLWMLTA